jgi:hypothetical protein
MDERRSLFQTSPKARPAPVNSVTFSGATTYRRLSLGGSAGLMRTAFACQPGRMKRPDRTDVMLAIGTVVALLASVALTVASWF